MKLIHLLLVTRGLDPRVHLLRKKMDCRVKPGNDVGCASAGRALLVATSELRTPGGFTAASIRRRDDTKFADARTYSVIQIADR
jgi:hypothetical protein